MRYLHFTFGLVFCSLFASASLAKVQLYPPEIIEASPDGFVKIRFEGKTLPNTVISINPDNSLIIKSIYPLKETQVPTSLKDFSKEFRKNLKSKKEGVFRFRAGCGLYNSTKSNAKPVTKLKVETMMFGKSVDRKWMALEYKKKKILVKQSCLKRPKLKGVKLSPSVKSNAQGYFKLITNLPEGSLQLLFSLKKKGPSNHLFPLKVSQKSVTSSTRFVKKPAPKKVVAEQEEAEEEPEEEADDSDYWYFKAQLGLGYNYHDLSQEVSQSNSIEFGNSKLPSYSFDIAAIYRNYEFELAYLEASEELKKASAPYTLLNSEYSLNSISLMTRYFVSDSPTEASTGYTFGYVKKTIPLFLVDASDNVDAGDMSLNYVAMGFVQRPELSEDYSFPWQLNLLVPIASDTPVGSDSSVDPKLSANFKFTAIRSWNEDYFMAGQLNLDYLISDYSYTTGITTRKGEVNLLATQIEFLVGINF